MTISSKEFLVKEYKHSIQRLKNKYENIGVKEEEFQKIYFEALKNFDCKVTMLPMSAQIKLFLKKCKLFCMCLSCIILLYNYKSLYSFLICNMQDYIYPGLRLLRKISIPFISLFPALTELYQETCLIQNPFFTIVDMDCWPCSIVDNIKEVQYLEAAHKQQSAPFIYKTEQKKINLNNIKQLYLRNKNMFDKEYTKIHVDNKYYLTPENTFASKDLEDNLYICCLLSVIHSNYKECNEVVETNLNYEYERKYVTNLIDKNIGTKYKDLDSITRKLNNFNVARILRQLIPRPKIVPKFGQSTERFIIIDSKHNSFSVPDTECNYSFLLVLSGARNIYLKPAEECKHQCKSFVVELKKSYLLWYNWWYWRPVVQTSINNETFIAHVGSYC